ncbi:MAG: DNA gyrase subunit B, partial [Chlamydiia bacterium]|nr:DNA gyrase subunit B [Chlamydiia bacterium]
IRTLLLTFFYRHMPALVENHFIYIAQPPLYRVVRKKKGRYIHSEKEMDLYLLELGWSDLKVTLGEAAEALSQERVRELVTLVLEVEELIGKIERKGVSFKEFLNGQDADGRYPRFLVTLQNQPTFIYSEEEFVQLRIREEESQRRAHDQKIAAIPPDERTEEMLRFHPKQLPFIELCDEEALKSLQARLERFGFAISHYYTPWTASILVEADGGHTSSCATLHEFVAKIRENGRKGIDIQRYKGLGEMNADQLCETTMEPSQRVLIQVTLPDAVAADHMFNMLMGEEVEPRRRFIERNALSVSNLDI